MALVSGAAFGIFFALLKASGSSAGLWPLVVARAGGVLVLVAILFALRVRPSGLGTATFLLPALFAGVLDASANILYFEAVQRGTLSLTAVLTSLYPAVTVLLARTVHSERLRRIQQLGMAVAVAGVALVTVG
jgi:drug/metabolite transporter (DMT)-like permease